MGNFIDNGMSFTPGQEALMVDMFEDAERADETAGYVLSGESDMVDPDVMVELYLDSPIERTNLASMLSKQLAKELVESYISVYEKQLHIFKTTGKPVVIHISAGADTSIRLSPAMEDDLDLFSNRYLDFIAKLPTHFINETLDRVDTQLKSRDFIGVSREFHSLRPDICIESIEHSKAPLHSLARVLAEFPESDIKETIQSALAGQSVEQVDMSPVMQGISL